MKFRSILATSALVAVPLLAHAQNVTGPYVDLGVGANFTFPLGYTENKAAPDWWGGKLQTRPSYAGEIGIGYGFGNGLRAELDGNYYHNTIHASDVTVDAGTAVNKHYRTSGGLNTYGFMLNGLYDLPLGWVVQPYVGAGVGYEWLQLAHRVIDGGGYYMGGSEGSFAYDLIAGLSYPLSFMPGLSATAEYRFTQLVSRPEYTLYYPGGVSNVKIGQSFNNTILIGLRYQLFNAPAAVAPAPAPAPVAAPAPAPAKTYLVFFDWDKATLTPKATQIIAEAASDSKTQNVTTLDVSGYTDTSGTAAYNQGLSERRAKAVAGKLVADGVPASEIEIQAYGETHLLVPTGPNVREPQNRRVEIVLN